MIPPTPDAPATRFLPPTPSPRRDAGVRWLEGFPVVFGWGLRRGFSGGRFRWIAGVVVGFGALLGLLLAQNLSPTLALWEFLDRGAIGVAVPLVALALVGRGYAEEVADQTLVYHLVRPVSRTTVYLGRFVAGAAPGVAAAAAMVLALLLASGVALDATSYVATAGVAALGALTVGAVYYALAAILRRGLVAGLVYTLVVEGLFQFLPGATQKLSLMHHVRSVLHRWTDADFAARSREVAERLRNAAAPLAPRGRPPAMLERAPEVWTQTDTALLVCGVVFLVAILVGAGSVKRRDYALKES